MSSSYRGNGGPTIVQHGVAYVSSSPGSDMETVIIIDGKPQSFDLTDGEARALAHCLVRLYPDVVADEGYGGAS